MVSAESLANLKPGNRNGVRHRVTKEYVTKLTDFLMDDFDQFIGELQALPPRDRVVAKLKLMDMIIPKKQELEVGAIETPKWEIVRASERYAHVETPVQDAEVIDAPTIAETSTILEVPATLQDYQLLQIERAADVLLRASSPELVPEPEQLPPPIALPVFQRASDVK
ncbi:hypothetical protein [Hymenobacter terrenus]|uniref:hypothetical protein n=1 Tax=Hymenobacter terrenus TaxID=1629124 RepID=UPI000619E746|nr:hypothetical protein [Hymenobacter terrenus]